MHIQIEDNHVCLTKFTTKNINFLSQLFEEGNLKPWDDLKNEYNLTNETSVKYQWLQLKHAISHKWKTIVKQNLGNDSNLLIQEHHLIEGG